MIPHFQIPRNSLAWLLLAQALLVLPHLGRLPVWILLAWFITVLWRVQIFRGRWPFPRAWMKLALVALCLAGLTLEYRRFFGLEPMVGLLITAFVLKLLEMRQKRDAVIVIFLGYFVAATQFLFSQTLLTTIYLLLTVTTLTTALLGLNQSAGHHYPWRSFRTAGTLMAQSLPLMLVLFIIMPRVGSLWAVPQQQHSARTGVSDSMSPGDFSSLVRDNSTAFRVSFDDAIPPPPFLYWRGLVLSDFDGRRWSQNMFNDYRNGAVNWSGDLPALWRQDIRTQGEPTRYQVILEATQQHWLYALPTPNSADYGLGVTRDFRLVSRRPIGNRFRYNVSSHLDFTASAGGLQPMDRRRELLLPLQFNPRAQREARQWWEEAGGDHQAYIDQVLGYFRSDFSYTLEPPALGEHSVDEFLWVTKRGFCEHFASAFVVMMRAAGIPARVVVGYQGGELNPLKDFLVVKQSDAHAWAEVWLEGEGWRRVDPTAAVAPQRIESGLDGAINPDEAELLDDPFSLDGYSSVPLLNMLRLRLEVMEYDWHRWVMDYGEDRQRGLLRDLLGEVSPWRVAAVLLVTGLLVCLLVGGSLMFSGRSRNHNPADKLYRRFLRRLKKHGIERRPEEGPRSLAQRIESENPQLAPWVARVTRAYEMYVYGGDERGLIGLRKLLKDGVTNSSR